MTPEDIEKLKKAGRLPYGWDFEEPMNLQQITKEAESKWDEKITRYCCEEHDKEAKSFLTEQIKLAYRAGAEAVIDDIPDDIVTNMVETVANGTAMKYNLDYQKQRLRDRWLITSQEDRKV